MVYTESFFREVLTVYYSLFNFEIIFIQQFYSKLQDLICSEAKKKYNILYQQGRFHFLFRGFDKKKSLIFMRLELNKFIYPTYLCYHLGNYVFWPGFLRLFKV